MGGRVIWEITNLCNYSCKYCIFSCDKKRLPNELNTDQIKLILDDLKKHDFKYLKITGGEPFTRLDLIEIIEYASSLGFDIDISTNASLINREKAIALKKSGVSMVHVSLDGHNRETHESVRGKNTFEPTVNGISELVRQNLYVRLGCVIFEGNQKYLEQIVAFAYRLGAKEIIFSRMEPVGRMRGDNSMVTTYSIEKIKGILNNNESKYPEIKVSYSFAKSDTDKNIGVCPGGTKFLSIDSEGRVSPCTWITEKIPEFVGGKTLHNSGLDQIYSESVVDYLNFKETVSEYGISGCPIQSVDQVKEIKEIINYFENNLKEDLSESTKYSRHSPLYSFTTENLGGYFSQFDFRGKKVLTVGGSGDQMINAYLGGAKDVYNFDINLFAKFYAELKLKALGALTFDEFVNFFSRDGSNILSKKTYQKIKEQLSPSTKYFFDRAYLYFHDDGAAFRESKLFNNKFDDPEKKIQYNPYLQSKGNYLKAKEAIKHKEISWFTGSLDELINSQIFRENKYDYICLSNIADNLNLSSSDHDYLYKFKDNCVKPLLGNLESNGTVFIAYIYMTNNVESVKRSLIDDKQIRLKVFDNLKGYSYREIDFPSAISGRDSVAYYVKK